MIGNWFQFYTIKHRSKVYTQICVHKLLCKLYIIQQGCRIDLEYYCSSLLSEMIPELNELSNSDYIFQQDGACPYLKAHPSVLWGKFASDCRVTRAQWMAYPQPWSQPPRLWYLVHTWKACLRCENPWCWALVRLIRECVGLHQTGGSRQGHLAHLSSVWKFA